MGTNEVAAAAGFLTVVRSDPHGLIGGYLILNLGGRPLEFHCSAPIKPNRAQEILYGATLEPYLYGEQIGQTLLAASKIDVPVICTDLAPVLAVAELTDRPVVMVLSDAETESRSVSQADSHNIRLRMDRPHGLAQPMHLFQNGGRSLALAGGNQRDRPRVESALASLGDSFDLNEPFGRIREAIEEAQRGEK